MAPESSNKPVLRWEILNTERQDHSVIDSKYKAYDLIDQSAGDKIKIILTYCP